GQIFEFVSAPWRSLIYRNVDTAYDYVDDSAIFPHMPLNSAGFDCRAPRVLAEWMVSIPSALAHPDHVESVQIEMGAYPVHANTDPQPYVEVPPGDPGYAFALSQAQSRLDQYHQGHRYEYCADTSDIIDPYIIDQVNRGKPVELDTHPVFDPKDPK